MNVYLGPLYQFFKFFCVQIGILISVHKNELFRLTPPGNLLHKYCDPASRGYLAHPDLLQQERIVLAQKYGYEPPVYDENDELFKKTKVVNLFLSWLNHSFDIHRLDHLSLRPKDICWNNIFKSRPLPLSTLLLLICRHYIKYYRLLSH